MARLSAFSGDDLSAFGETIRSFARTATSMEDAARRTVGELYDNLVDDDGKPALALARLYKTHPYARLPVELQEFARGVLGGDDPESEMRCLTLLATRGDLPQWNDREGSEGHKAIPLPSVEFVNRLPMVAALVGQLGLELSDVIRPADDRIVELAQKNYDVFHVADPASSEFVVAKDFVAEHDVRSALGFGGVLFTGEFFAVVLFSHVAIDEKTAETIRILSLATRVALMPFGLRVFEQRAAA